MAQQILLIEIKACTSKFSGHVGATFRDYMDTALARRALAAAKQRDRRVLGEHLGKLRRLPTLADEFVDYVYDTFYGGSDSWERSDQDAYEQSRKLAAFCKKNHQPLTSLGEWMPNWA